MPIQSFKISFLSYFYFVILTCFYNAEYSFEINLLGWFFIVDFLAVTALSLFFSSDNLILNFEKGFKREISWIIF